MDRSLDPDLLRSALGDSDALPSAEELALLLAEVEMSIFAGWEPQRNQVLIDVAWYLHGIASSSEALRLYGQERQRRAFQVSGHFFDLQIDACDDERQRRRYLFAAQVGYVRSGLAPNAHAVFRRWHRTSPSDLADAEEVSLTLGCLLLGGEYSAAKRLSGKILASASTIARDAGLRGFHGTLYEAELFLCQGSLSLVRYLQTGEPEQLQTAQLQFASGASASPGRGDLDSRWVAAHLLHLSDDFGASSVWEVLPGDLPPGVARAFVLGKPRVSMFWPPQLAALSHVPSSITDSSVRRAVLALPTSAGKSLLAQVIAAVHLARGGNGVCYVAPTRSLCREVETTFGSRLRFIASAAGERPRFDVMTPERLHASLRTDAAEVLEQYGLFIFDEVQSVGDGARGWVLESALALLHAATRNTSHRIITISPTAGNLAQFAAWTGADGEGQVVVRSDWRAPRRLNAVYSPEPRWEESAETSRRSARWPIRRTVPLYGQMHLLLGGSRSPKSLHFVKSIGTLQLKVSADGRQQERESSTPHYEMNLPMITHLGRAGSVLVLVGTRASCVRYARMLSARLGEDRKVPLDLISSVAGKLGDDHPLVAALSSGVAFHHGALPWDVQSSIEEAVRLGQVTYLIATTTLTEGVNLPVRSVFIAETGFHDGTSYQRVMTGARLLNAVGRAGRALAETEGWAVLADRNCPDSEFCGTGQAFEELTIQSNLTTPESLASLQDLETLLSAGEDLLLSAAGAAADFVGFNWFLMEACERLRNQPFSVESTQILESTLAWRQLPSEARERWNAIADASQEAYAQADPSRRRRWVQSGLPLSTAAELEVLAKKLAEVAGSSEQILEPMKSLTVLEDNGILERLLRLPAAPKVRFFSVRQGRSRCEIQVDPVGLLHDWLAGFEFGDLAANHLGAVVDCDYRDEQLADAVSGLFIDYMPWVVGVLFQWAWEMVEESGEPHTFRQLLRQLVGGGAEVPVDLLVLLEKQSKHFALPAMIRHGVNNEAALALARAGLSSRSLAVKIGATFEQTGNSDDGGLQAWLCDLGLDGWIRDFDVSALAVRELLRFARVETSTLLGDVLNEKEHRIPIEWLGQVQEGSRFEFERVDSGSSIGRLGLVRGGELEGLVPLMYQHDIARLMELDLPLHLRSEVSDDGIFLFLKLNRAALLGEDNEFAIAGFGLSGESVAGAG